MNTMAERRFLAATMIVAAILLTMAAGAQAALVIDEFWADDADNQTAQYVEFYNTTSSSFDMTGLTLLVVNGDTFGEVLIELPRFITRKEDGTDN